MTKFINRTSRLCKFQFTFQEHSGTDMILNKFTYYVHKENNVAIHIYLKTKTLYTVNHDTLLKSLEMKGVRRKYYDIYYLRYILLTTGIKIN